jgi:mono/diheme cytochrome c family protein
MKRLLLTAMSALLAVSIGFAAQSKEKVTIPVNKTTASDGKQMFTNYCAPCHGVDGKGHGPVAAALKKQPDDLTGLTKKNNGKFPDAHIVTVLKFGADIPSHGSSEMPVWGPILGKMNKTNVQDKELRISNLSRYLESIQAR